MPHQYLNWDSAFFSKKIFNLTIDCSLSKEDIAFINEKKWDVVYIDLVKASADIEEYIEGLGGKLVDRKVTYTKKNTSKRLGTSNIFHESVQILSPELEQMAYLSGKFSRFYLDEKFRPYYRPLYYEWIKKSIHREIADDVIVVIDENGDKVGFITLSKTSNIGKIGLIAVNENSRGRGYGIELLSIAEEWYEKNNVNFYNVVTQLDNIPACKLYEKAGYIQSNLKYIYHLWNNDTI